MTWKDRDEIAAREIRSRGGGGRRVIGVEVGETGGERGVEGR